MVLRSLLGDFNDQLYLKTIIIMNLVFLKFHDSILQE